MDGRFGINMKKYCRSHEAAMLDALGRGDEVTEELLKRHLEKLRWMQHERLIHLIVTLMVVITELVTLCVVIFDDGYGLAPAVIMLGLAILLGFYFYHYFFLENTVQRWYLIADEMQSVIDERTR